MTAAELNRAAARCERLANHHAREACSLAGHAVFLDPDGETPEAAALIARALREERRETDLLELARAFRARATALDHTRRRTRSLLAVVQGPALHPAAADVPRPVRQAVQT